MECLPRTSALPHGTGAHGTQTRRGKSHGSQDENYQGLKDELAGQIAGQETIHDADKDSEDEWIKYIDDPELLYLVREEYDRWLEWQEEDHEEGD